ncbi:hypothetical protein DIPPA_11325 [Diplonema papillatum]|nr:hypothetical protein DIPPA_11325 [Diplonema papillatum]KAJ9447899.1 hypothetical protein DIPPA_11325 [Diplonema papillatum]
MARTANVLVEGEFVTTWMTTTVMSDAEVIDAVQSNDALAAAVSPSASIVSAWFPGGGDISEDNDDLPSGLIAYITIGCLLFVSSVIATLAFFNLRKKPTNAPEN